MNRSFRSIKKIVRSSDMQANAAKVSDYVLLPSDDIRVTIRVIAVG